MRVCTLPLCQRRFQLNMCCGVPRKAANRRLKPGKDSILCTSAGVTPYVKDKSLVSWGQESSATT